MCFVRILYTELTDWFVLPRRSVYCAVRTGALYTTRFNTQQFYVLPHTVYLCVLCGSQNKQRLFCYTALTDWFLCALTKLRKIFISSLFLLVCLSVRSSVVLSFRMEQLGSQSANFYKISYWTIFRKYVANIYVSMKSDKNVGCFTGKHVCIYNSAVIPRLTSDPANEFFG